MPLYPFKCPTCRVTTDVTTTIATRDTVDVRCPVCAGRMTRQPAAPAFALKGAGFFRTDYDTGDRHAVEEP
jgi:putative FmdB family regulatory protein